MFHVAAVEIGADDVGLWVGVFVGLVSAAAVILAVANRVLRRKYAEQDWIRRQMAENGKTAEAQTEGLTIRDVLDSLVITAGRLDLNQQKLGVNQAEQRQQIAEIGNRLDDHLVHAAESLRGYGRHLAEAREAMGRLDEHLANHPKDTP